MSLTRSQVVSRALKHDGKGKYELACGGRNPANPSPFARSKKGKPGTQYADCSGFVAWCLGYDRVQGLGTSKEEWYSTTEQLDDALKPGGLFTKLTLTAVVEPGDVIVYPAGVDPKGKKHKYGHVGIITRVNPDFVRLGDKWWTKLWITHCSTGGDSAIRTSNAKLWADRGGYIIRYNHFFSMPPVIDTCNS